MKYEVVNGCVLCGTCAAACAAQAIAMSPKGARIDQDKCVECGRCYDNCPAEAIARTEEKKD